MGAKGENITLEIVAGNKKMKGVVIFSDPDFAINGMQVGRVVICLTPDRAYTTIFEDGTKTNYPTGDGFSCT